MIGLYVDDILCIGNDEMLNEVTEDFRNLGYKLKINETLSDYLSCKITFSNSKEKACLTQPHLIKNLDKKFGTKVRQLRRYKTPLTPGRHTVRDEEKEVVEDETHELYQSEWECYCIW